MLDQLSEALARASGMTAGEIKPILVRTQDTALGDYAFPCFALAKTRKMAPPQCAKEILANLELPAEFEKVQAVGPYLNFFLKRDKLCKELISSILSDSFKLQSSATGNAQPVIIEYSSPNIAKNLHVGHMRTTLIGLSLEKIYKALGREVITINHLGDWGVQFGFIWAATQIWGSPADATIDSLVELYVKAVQLDKLQEEDQAPAELKHIERVSKIARDYFIKLEENDAVALEFWQWCLDLSLQEFKKIYHRIGIDFDHYTGESFYRDQIDGVEELVRSSGLLENSRGALGVDLGKELGFVRIFAEDGRSLYITRDIAAALYRESTYHPEKILYVVAAQQSLHFRQLKELLHRMKQPVAEKIIHVAFGFVPGMKTREGTAILFSDFLNEAHERALKVYLEQVSRRPEDLNEEQIAEQVAIGASYFYFLKHSNTKDFNFSWEQAMSFQGDSGPYLQYALARIYSIEANANQAGISSEAKDLVDFRPDLILDKEAYEVISQLSRFSESVERAAAEYEPSIVAAYALDLAKNLAKAYNSLRVVGVDAELAKSRLALFISARKILASALTLIGVPIVKRM